MVKVKFDYSEDKRSIVLAVNGHAGYEDRGKDIICSASSILAYTVAQCVSDLHKDGKLLKKPTIKLDKGNAKIVCKPTEDAYVETLHVFFVAERGYALLASNYPEYVRLKPFGRGEEEAS